MGKKRKEGVSRTVRESVGQSPYDLTSTSADPSLSITPQVTVLRQRAMATQREEARQRFAQETAGLSTQTRKILAEIRGEECEDAGESQPGEMLPAQEAVPADDDADWETLPQERDVYDAFLQDTQAILQPLYQGRYRKDDRTWRQRLERAHLNWMPLIPALADAYLQWKYPPSAPPTSSTSSQPLPSEDATPPSPANETNVDPSNSAEDYDFDIEVVDIYTLKTSAKIKQPATLKSAAEALVLNGYLGTVPYRPSIAISLKTLELYRRLRLRQPGFSIQAFSKVTCDLYAFPYRRRHRDIFSDAFDIYLSILRVIDQRLAVALGRDTPNWRVQNECPACTYELEDEPALKYKRMIAMDGNNSLKRIIRANTADRRVFNDSDFFLSNDYVNTFANEVQSAKRTSQLDGNAALSVNPAPPVRPTQEVDNNNPAPPTQPTQEVDNGSRALAVPKDDTPQSVEPNAGDGGHDEAAGGGNGETEADGSVDEAAACTDNWKAAAADSKKKMWAIFDETGIFACACRHGFILWIADMVRSGELAKYPMAIISKSIDVLGDDLLLGYDIGCATKKTIANSSIGAKFKACRCELCVGAFHGYSHNFRCQKNFHPNAIKGAGLEDFETMERIFSSSNHVAGVTRYMSAFRRRVFIDMHFTQWNQDKYLNIATFLHENYTQALRILKVESVELAEAMTSLGIGEGDIKKWLKEEDEYLATVGQEAEGDALAVIYIELLQKLTNAESAHSSATTSFISERPAEDTPSQSASRTRRLETERRYATERYESLLREVIDVEVRMGISHQRRWTPMTPEYREALKYMTERKCQVALENLVRLVINRILELHKLNLSGTGYKMRTLITKSLQTRCKAIQNAIQVYNTAALELNPPRPTLEWSKVSHYGFLEEFVLLQDSRQDIRDKRWAQPAIRAAMKQSLRLERANEELTRCNVELRRMLTFLVDENAFLEAKLSTMRAEGNALAGAFEDYATHRIRVNGQVLARVYQTLELDGFTGETEPGIRKGTTRPSRENSSELSAIGDQERQEVTGELGAGMLGVDEDDEVAKSIGEVVNYLVDLHL